MKKLKKAEPKKKAVAKKPAKMKKNVKKPTTIKRAGATAKPATRKVGKLDNTVAFNVSLPEKMLKKLDKRVADEAKKQGTAIKRSAFVRDIITKVL